MSPKITKDEPTVFQPVVRALELEAIRMYRAKYTDGPPWQELDHATRDMWVGHAEKARAAPPTALPGQGESR